MGRDGGGQTLHCGGLLAALGSVQVVLDCPADSCFEYIYQHEPYLRDPVAYPKVQVSAGGGDPCATQDTTTAPSLCSQMLIYLFYVLPFLCLCIYALLRPGCSWLPDWSLVFAGAIAQVRARSWGGEGEVAGGHPPCIWSSSQSCLYSPIINYSSVDLNGAGDEFARNRLERACSL